MEDIHRAMQRKWSHFGPNRAVKVQTAPTILLQPGLTVLIDVDRLIPSEEPVKV